MRPFTQIGEVVISKDGRDYLLRPSFVNIARIGSPSDIVEIFNRVFSDYYLSCINYTKSKVDTLISGEEMVITLEMALHVIQCCCEDRLPKSLTGHVTESYMWHHYESGVTPNDIIILARHLMHFGMIGEEGDRSSEGDASDEGFDPLRFIAFASSPKGFSKPQHEAEQMTMVQFQSLYKITFPEIEKIKEQRTQEELAAAEFDKMEQIMADLEAENARSAG
jgi:hypothetical protein